MIKFLVMKKIDLVKLDSDVMRLYQKINDSVGLDSISLVNLAFPLLDGKADNEVVSQMMFLRQDLRALRLACSLLETRIFLLLMINY